MKEKQSEEIIRDAVSRGLVTAVMLSFGKDSMVLAELIRRAAPRSPMRAHGFPLPVIYHRDPWFPHKHEFAERVIKSWAMEVHDQPPMECGVKVKPDMLELVARYSFGSGVMDVPKNVCAPTEYARRDYICGRLDWIDQPKVALQSRPWQQVLHGHKSSDVDPFEGHVPLNASAAIVGGIRVVFPLRDWTDADIWDFIESERVPYQKTRYQDREELIDKWLNNDYIHACTACIDPREKRQTVYCPKLRIQVPNVGGKVLRFEEKPDYIKKETT
jgi:3'-phosphoadenosine 5'-phosphosulfate sulfotransferase (PAPS reductase)/FAD synthetase